VPLISLVHPLERWSTFGQVTALAVAAHVLLLTIALSGSLSRALRSGGGRGIVAFELAGSVDKARLIVAGWARPGRGPMRAAARSLAVDVPFLVAYGLELAVLGALAAKSARGHGWIGAADIALHGRGSRSWRPS